MVLFLYLMRVIVEAVMYKLNGSGGAVGQDLRVSLYNTKHYQQLLFSVGGCLFLFSELWKAALLPLASLSDTTGHEPSVSAFYSLLFSTFLNAVQHWAQCEKGGREETEAAEETHRAGRKYIIFIIINCQSLVLKLFWGFLGWVQKHLTASRWL